MPGQGPRTGLRLRQAHWVGLGKPGQKSWYRIGSDPGDGLASERPSFEMQFDYFEMAAYPVTVGEWHAFIDGGGYLDPLSPWWTAAGEAAQTWLRHRLGQSKGGPVVPRGWNYPGWNNPLQPVMWLTAHDTLAYAYWAAPLHDQGRGNLHLQLPTEAMWEAGVRGPLPSRLPKRPQQRWPHDGAGAAPDALAFNHGYSQWRRPSPVGVFSRGLSALGLSDAAGNVWEWCSNAVDDDAAASYEGGARQRAAQEPARRHDDDTRLAQRGGGYSSASAHCRVARRDRRRPGNGSLNSGVRLVRCVLPHSEP